MENNQNKEVSTSYCQLPIHIREVDGEYYVDGWIYITHMDRANDGDASVSNTMFSKRCMEQIAESINKGIGPISMLGARRTVSDQHDWIKKHDASIEPIGIAVPPVEVRNTPDGQWGVYGTTHFKKEHPDFESNRKDIELGYKPGFSIEFVEGESEKVSVAGRVVKVIKSLKEFVGYALAGARQIANPQALITSFGYREVEEALNKIVEMRTMTGEQIDVQIHQAPEEVPKVEVREAEPMPPAKEAVVVIEAPKLREVSQEELDAKIRESKAYKELMQDTQEIKSRVLKTGVKEEGTMEDIKIREMNESLNDPIKFRSIAQDYISESGLVSSALKECQVAGFKGFNYNTKVRVTGKGVKIIGIRANLDTATNAGTYTQQPVELADVFAPGLNDIFNNATELFSYLGKEPWSNSYYQWRNVTDKDPNSVTSSVDRDDVNIITNYSSKIKLQTPLKVYRRGVDVTDFIQRYSDKQIGDLFMTEVELQMKEMMNDIETDLFAEVADGTGNAVLGLEAVADVTGNTTLYGFTRSTTNKLTTGTLADTYVNAGAAVSEAALRTGIGKLRIRGARYEDMAIVVSPIGKGFIFNLLDTNRRFNNTVAEFGFSQKTVPTYDGIPIVEAWKCASTLATAGNGTTCCAYIIDTTQDKIIVGMEPRLINLAKVNAGTQAYVETHIAHVYKDPRKIYLLDNFITG